MFTRVFETVIGEFFPLLTTFLLLTDRHMSVVSVSSRLPITGTSSESIECILYPETRNLEETSDLSFSVP